jgi:hypothetical protein
MDRRVGSLALGLGTAGCLATAGLLLSPGTALGQASCNFGSTLLCKTVESCIAWSGNTCAYWYTEYLYYSKIKK